MLDVIDEMFIHCWQPLLGIFWYYNIHNLRPTYGMRSGSISPEVEPIETMHNITIMSRKIKLWLYIEIAYASHLRRDGIRRKL